MMMDRTVEWIKYNFTQKEWIKMVIDLAQYLYNAIIAGVGNCITGVSIGIPDNKSTWILHFNQDATQEQKNTAADIINTLNYDVYKAGATLRDETIKNDPGRTELVDKLKFATSDQIDNWIDNNVTSLVAARVSLKAIVKVLVFLIKE